MKSKTSIVVHGNHFYRPGLVYLPPTTQLQLYYYLNWKDPIILKMIVSRMDFDPFVKAFWIYKWPLRFQIIPPFEFLHELMKYNRLNRSLYFLRAKTCYDRLLLPKIAELGAVNSGYC